MRKIKSMNTKSNENRNFFTKSTLEIDKARTIAVEREKEKYKLKKIPFDEKYVEKKEIEVDNKMTIEEQDRNYLNSLIVANLNESDKRRFSRMRNQLDEIFQTKLTFDRNEYLTFFRKGISVKEKKTNLRESSKISFPCMQKKKIVDNKIVRNNHDTDLKQKYQPVILDRQKIYKNHHEIINKELKVKLSYPIKLGSQFNQSTKIKDTFIDIERDDQIQSKTNKLLYLKQFKDNPIRKCINEGNRIAQAQLNERNERRKIIIAKWKETIIRCYFEFKSFKIDLKTFFKMNLVSTKPYESPSSKLLFRAIKEGKTQIAIALIKENPFLIHNYNLLEQTPIHYAAKYNMSLIIQLRSTYYGNINIRDKFGRTALHYGAIKGHLDIVRSLLIEMADPLLRDHDNKLPHELTNDKSIETLLKFTILIYKTNGSYSSISGYEMILKGVNQFLNRSRFI